MRRNAFIDEAHGADRDVITDKGVTADNAAIGTDIHIVTDGDRRIAFVVGANGCVLPDRKVFANPNGLGDYDTRTMADDQTLVDVSAEHYLGAVFTYQTVVDAFGKRLQCAVIFPGQIISKPEPE